MNYFDELLYALLFLIIVCIAILFINGMSFVEIFDTSIKSVFERLYNDDIGKFLLIFVLCFLPFSIFSFFRRF